MGASEEEQKIKKFSCCCSDLNKLLKGISSSFFIIHFEKIEEADMPIYIKLSSDHATDRLATPYQTMSGDRTTEYFDD